jgi:hypothetical protein
MRITVQVVAGCSGSVISRLNRVLACNSHKLNVWLNVRKMQMAACGKHARIHLLMVGATTATCVHAFALPAHCCA